MRVGCPGSGRRGHMRESVPGLWGRPPTTTAGCISMSMPPSPSIIPIPRKTPRRPGNTFGYRPTDTTPHRLNMALGPRDRHRLDPHPYRLHLAAKPRPDQAKDPTGLRKARLPATPGNLSYLPATIDFTSQPPPAPFNPARLREKLRLTEATAKPMDAHLSGLDHATGTSSELLVQRWRSAMKNE